MTVHKQLPCSSLLPSVLEVCGPASCGCFHNAWLAAGLHRAIYAIRLVRSIMRGLRLPALASAVGYAVAIFYLVRNTLSLMLADAHVNTDALS